MSDRFKLVPEVHLFLLDRDSRVLLLRRCNRDYENGNYSVVAAGRGYHQWRPTKSLLLDRSHLGGP